MRITSKPVDVDALRQEWVALVDYWVRLLGTVDEKTQRIARRGCFRSIAEDLRRYDCITRFRLLRELFVDGAFASTLAHRIEVQGPQSAATWLEEQLGVKLEGESS